MSKDHKIVLLAGVVVLVVIFLFTGNKPSPTGVIGSVIQGSEYMATTTPYIANLTDIASTTSQNNAATNPGTLGSVVIEATNASDLLFIDATTTDVNKRASSQSTSSVIVAWLPANAATGTYTFDVNYVRGLIMVYGVTASRPTSTITFRQR